MFLLWKGIHIKPLKPLTSTYINCIFFIKKTVNILGKENGSVIFFLSLAIIKQNIKCGFSIKSMLGNILVF